MSFDQGHQSFDYTMTVITSIFLFGVPVMMGIFIKQLTTPTKPAAKAEPRKSGRLRYPIKRYCERHLICLRKNEFCVVVTPSECLICQPKNNLTAV